MQRNIETVSLTGIKIINSLMSFRALMLTELQKVFQFSELFGVSDEERPHVRSYPVLCVSELGLKFPHHSKDHVFYHHPHFSGSEDTSVERWLWSPYRSICSQTGTFLALNASAIDIALWWLFQQWGRAACSHLHILTLSWAPGHMCRLRRYSQRSSRLRFTWGPAGPSS